jgi:hypothetical protein
MKPRGDDSEPCPHGLSSGARSSDGSGSGDEPKHKPRIVRISKSALAAVVADKIWTLERPVWFSGVRLRARTTVVRLDDGGLLVHSPAPPTDALAEQLRALGPVNWLVVPNCFHHLGTPAAAAHFPEARVVGPASALKRNKALRLHLDINGPQFGKDVPEFETLPLRRVEYNDRAPGSRRSLLRRRSRRNP